jgi:uncharacterized protein (UPF0248 family)
MSSRGQEMPPPSVTEKLFVILSILLLTGAFIPLHRVVQGRMVDPTNRDPLMLRG